jgi:hypothetical protein
MNSPAISGDVFAGKPAAYAGKSLHVTVDRGYTVWTNDGSEPIARCIDLGTAHLLAAAPDMVQALREVIGFLEAVHLAGHGEPDHPSIIAARKALAKAAL